MALGHTQIPQVVSASRVHVQPFGEACYVVWQGGSFVKKDEPQGSQFCRKIFGYRANYGAVTNSRRSLAPWPGGGLHQLTDVRARPEGNLVSRFLLGYQNLVTMMV